MYLDNHNSTTPTRFYPVNTTIWANHNVITNQSLHAKNTKDDTTVKFVLKNEKSAVKRPIKVFTIPIVDKNGETDKDVDSPKDPKKSIDNDDDFEEEHSVEYEYEDVSVYEDQNQFKDKKKKNNKNKNKHYYNKNKNKPMRGCKSKRRVSHKLKKIGKYLIPGVIGFMAFKLILLPLLFKILAIISAKGLFLSLVSFIMASLLSLKQIVGATGRHRKRDVTFIHVPVYPKAHHHNKNDEYLEYEHNPYNSYYDEEPNYKAILNSK